jgi:hypothetical protein
LNEIRGHINEINSLLNPVGIRNNTQPRYNYNTFSNPIRIPRRNETPISIFDNLDSTRELTSLLLPVRNRRRTPTRTQEEITDSETLSNLLQQFLNPVEVFPTERQIQNATRVVNFREIENPLNNSCPISLEQFTPDTSVTQIRYCGHIFSRQEINAWFRSNVRCPVCRYDIRNYVNNIETNATTTTNTTERNTSNGVVEDDDDDDEENENNNENNDEQDEDTDNIRQNTNNHSQEVRNSLYQSEGNNFIDISRNDIIQSLNGIANDTIQQLFNTTNNTNNRYLFDASSGTFIFETYIPIRRTR